MASHSFSIQQYRGNPMLFKDGEAVPPLFCWTRDPVWETCKDFYKVGYRYFSFFYSPQHYAAPWWTGEGEYDFSRFDNVLTRFHEEFPDAFCIPRVFVCAPEWWLYKHPDEMCGFALGGPERTNWQGGRQGTLHESFASELWKKEEGEAFRTLLRHLKQAPYAECIMGIHICNGITGEWHLWSPQHAPDTSLPMKRRFGRPIPPPDERTPEYQKCLHQATVDAISHFCGIVKEETDWLTCIFYGYTPDSVGGQWRIEGDHRAAGAFHRLQNVDMVSAPHSYLRRAPGGDAYFRNYPASLGRHGKLFLDEGDDRTWLNSMREIERDTPANREESIQVLRREFGNMITHQIGMWYMDLRGGYFDDPELVRELGDLHACLNRYAGKLTGRNAEVAVIASVEGEFALPQRGTEGNLDYNQLFDAQIEALCKMGAPFDFFVSDDLDPEVMKQYKLVILLDEAGLSAEEKNALEQVRGNTRTHTIVRPFENTCALRKLLQEAGIHIYSETDDVFQCSKNTLMLHAASGGMKRIVFPGPVQVTELPEEKVLGLVREMEVSMKKGETKLYYYEFKKEN